MKSRGKQNQEQEDKCESDEEKDYVSFEGDETVQIWIVRVRLRLVQRRRGEYYLPIHHSN